MQIFHKIFELSSQIYQIIIIFSVKSKTICGFYLINLANFLRVFKKINVFDIVLTKLWRGCIYKKSNGAQAFHTLCQIK